MCTLQRSLILCPLCHATLSSSTQGHNRQACSAGCTIAILVENGRAYFAHIRPRGSAPSDPHLAGQANRVDLAYNMGAVGGFDGQTVTDPRHYIVYGGNAANEVRPRAYRMTRPCDACSMSLCGVCGAQDEHGGKQASKRFRHKMMVTKFGC